MVSLSLPQLHLVSFLQLQCFLSVIKRETYSLNRKFSECNLKLISMIIKHMCWVGLHLIVSMNIILADYNIKKYESKPSKKHYGKWWMHGKWVWVWVKWWWSKWELPGQ